jgi:hypothetical protein
MINQIAATIPNVVGDGFDHDHGDTVERPRPDPSVNRMIETPTAASAPPTMAAHSTADAELSTDCSGTRTASDFVVMAIASAKRELEE